MITRDFILRTIKWESGGDMLNGGVTDDLDDPGGLTKWGISQEKNPDLDVKSLSLDDAVSIYEERYWKRLNCSEVNSDRIKWKLFDMGVNLGIVKAALIAQK